MTLLLIWPSWVSTLLQGISCLRTLASYAASKSWCNTCRQAALGLRGGRRKGAMAVDPFCLSKLFSLMLACGHSQGSSGSDGMRTRANAAHRDAASCLDTQAPLRCLCYASPAQCDAVPCCLQCVLATAAWSGTARSLEAQAVAQAGGQACCVSRAAQRVGHLDGAQGPFTCWEPGAARRAVHRPLLPATHIIAPALPGSLPLCPWLPPCQTALLPGAGCASCGIPLTCLLPLHLIAVTAAQHTELRLGSKSLHQPVPLPSSPAITLRDPAEKTTCATAGHKRSRWLPGFLHRRRGTSLPHSSGCRVGAHRHQEC